MVDTLRARVVLHESDREPVVGVAVQLLGVLGHDVTLADTPEAALAAAAEAPTELLVLGVTDSADQRHWLDRIALLPPHQRPRQVAMLSDVDVETGPLVRRTLPDVRVHVFVRHVHAIGLLGVIKRMAGTN